MLIGITGKAGSGKDTIGHILREDHGFACISFAFPLKNAISTMLGVPYEKWEDREWKEAVLPVWGRSPRYLAQKLGTEWGRQQVHDNIWINLALDRAKQANDEGYEHVCITDVRFRNEADAIRGSRDACRTGNPGRIIQVLRDSSDLSADAKGHASEAGIGEPAYTDLFLENNGTIRSLGNKVAELLKVINDEAI